MDVPTGQHQVGAAAAIQRHQVGVESDRYPALAGQPYASPVAWLNGQAATAVSLAWLLVSAGVGEAIPVEYSRDGAGHQATITLAEQP